MNCFGKLYIRCLDGPNFVRIKIHSNVYGAYKMAVVTEFDLEKLRAELQQEKQMKSVILLIFCKSLKKCPPNYIKSR